MKTYKILLIISGLSLMHKLVYFDYSCYTCNEQIDFWPLADYTDYARTYAANLFNRINYCLFYLAIFLIDKKYREYVFLFLIMEVAIFIEFMLSYNKPWFALPWLGDHMNIGLSHFFVIFKAMILLHALRYDRS